MGQTYAHEKPQSQKSTLPCSARLQRRPEFQGLRLWILVRSRFSYREPADFGSHADRVSAGGTGFIVNSSKPAAATEGGEMDQSERLLKRVAPVEMSPDEFRRLGYRMVDRIADWLGTLPNRPVTPGESPKSIRQLLGSRSIPQLGCDPQLLLDEAADLLLDHSLSNGHPRFLGFITSSAAPIGALGDLLAAAVNPNLSVLSQL